MVERVLVVMALEAEAQNAFSDAGVEVLFTGVGKVNATYRLTRALAASAGSPDLVLNFGTAGSRHFPTGALVACRHFVQRDMDVGELGFAHGQTPFEDVPRILEFPACFAALPHAVCATGDRFETLDHAPDWEVLDMEAYALAKVCWLERIPFACAKFISDGADANATISWQENLPRAAAGFHELYRAALAR